MRRLIYVPIVHTAADLGTPAEAVKHEHVRRHGRGEWLRTRRLIDEVWEGLRSRLLALGLNYNRVRIYQDSLPVCGRELDIVREVAQRGSRNYALIMELLERGASVEGTESPSLLREEYDRIQSAISTDSVACGRTRRGLPAEGLAVAGELSPETNSTAPRPPDQAREEYAREGERILRQRDEFISRRIDESLKEEEVGILFIGLLHRVDRFLPPDVEVQYLIHRLPFHIAPEGPAPPSGHDA
jgi:hypothetical protein